MSTFDLYVEMVKPNWLAKPPQNFDEALALVSRCPIIWQHDIIDVLSEL